MQRLSDYIVQRRSESSIKALAQQCRVLGKVERSMYFNVVKFLQNSFKESYSKKGKLLFALVPDNHPLQLPYVEYQPLTLVISRSILRKAEVGDPLSRFKLAHETGHIVMHDHFAHSFSYEKNVRVRSVEDERSAEWQANTFAKYFLLPDWIFFQAASESEILERTRVPKPLFEERFEDVVALCLHRGVSFEWGAHIGRLALA